MDPSFSYRPRILLCFSGSVATIKVPELVVKLHDLRLSNQALARLAEGRRDTPNLPSQSTCISTSHTTREGNEESPEIRLLCSSKAAMHFLDKAEKYNSEMWKRFVDIGGKSLIVYDEVEWESWNKIGDPVIHIDLRRWADIVVVAPASADLLAKISAGISDTLLLCVLRAWDFSSKPCIVCPAMNTVMWDHPVTNSCLEILRGWGYRVVGPVIKTLACNDTGNGAMSAVDDIVLAISDALHVGPTKKVTHKEPKSTITAITTTTTIPWFELLFLVFLLVCFYVWYLFFVFDDTVSFSHHTAPLHK